MGVPGRWLQVVLAIALGGLFALTGTPHAQGLSPRQQAGQRVIYSYPGLTPPQSLLDRIRAGEAAGVIFFGENISGSAQIAGVIKQLDDANAQSPVHAPLLLMTDQEGGQVRRLPGEPTLSEKQVGQAADPPAAATQAGTGAGQNLKGVGMNVNLAPVLDVYRQEGDFDDHYGRSYSKNPAEVAALGEAFVRAQQQTGVAATAKHFPGLGSAATDQNTDTAPVTLDVPLQTLRNVDETPYPAAFSAGVKLVMVSWATYPALDRAHPAGLSPAVVRQELRQRLGFAGVTITDALEAGSLQAFGTTGQRAVAAASAGMDLILCSARDVAQGDEAADALVSAVQSGGLDQADFTAAVDRVSALRNGL
ncbi:beta-N-acetylhexosaminidase [Amycolatopsis acidiphila]|uniref:Beta-N-acetylhexosaminidase n=1 Tax=Amycolatopsis acidiphila TaxID=715473 RepID=A0A558AKG8_9PSEU|nr:glycoside hydrolase family 3 N-terminal domain-containing protein [Amycolatopsis acidiphila]TVT24752.1 beta-N-acetylhexosaminidase [Amycolatopsis acidiphila]UIJ62720.1 beta-N-acetylhexosaminidase [Amycolatopsis acidiphila]GHG63784.1 glycoside hydrolase family 3 [Amycolatopsis acidiphila]